jgi:hypothetical protein
MILMILCCLIPVGALAAVLVFGLPASSVVVFALVLLCPLSHVAMMAFMGRDHDGHRHLPPNPGRAPAAPGDSGP